MCKSTAEFIVHSQQMLKVVSAVLNIHIFKGKYTKYMFVEFSLFIYIVICISLCISSYVYSYILVYF